MAMNFSGLDWFLLGYVLLIPWTIVLVVYTMILVRGWRELERQRWALRRWRAAKRLARTQRSMWN